MPLPPSSCVLDSRIVGSHRLGALAVVFALALGAAASSPARATTYNSPTVDGLITVNPVDPTDWDADELLHEDPVGDSAWGACNDLQGLWVTWDADGIYFGVQGQIWNLGDPPCENFSSNSVNLYIDVDYGDGTGVSDMSLIDPSETLGAIGRNLRRTLTVGSGFGCDFGYTTWAGQYDLGFLDLADPSAPVNRIDEITDGRDLVGRTGYELFVPWTVLYPGAAGGVPPGTQIAVVVAQVGGGDSLSPESMPDGIDPDAGDRNLEQVIAFTVDADADGVPDEDWPPAGSISGTVTLSDASDVTTVVDVVALLDGLTEVGRASTPPGGGDYTIFRLPAGQYTVAVESNAYLADAQVVDVGENEDVTGIDFAAIKVNGGVQLALQFVDGPEAATRTLDVVVELFEPGRDEPLGSVTLAPADPLDVLFKPVRDGDYTLVVTPQWPDSAGAAVITRTGYRPLHQDVGVANDSVTDLGTLDLALVQPTKLVYYEPSADRDGDPITSTFTTVSLPDSSFYSYVEVEMGFTDDEGNEAVYGVGDVTLSTTRMDPAFPSEGRVQFWSSPDGVSEVAQPLEGTAAWEPAPGSVPTGRASFFFTDDVNEVVRLRASHASVRDGVLEIGVLPIEPAVIVLEAAARQMVAGQPGGIELQGQLKDIAHNDVRLADFEITFDITPSVPGLRPSLVFTESDGSFGQTGDVLFYSEVADSFTVIARATTASGKEIESDPIEIEVVPDVPYDLALSASVALENDHPRIDYRLLLTDAFGNPSPRPGSVAQITTSPADLVESAPASVTLDDITATGEFPVPLRPDATGVVETTVRLPGLPVEETRLQTEVFYRLVASDERAPESDENHNTLPEMDLTALYARVERDTLVVQVPVVTSTAGGHMMLLLESTRTPAGATSDAFKFPITYEHTLLPDFVFTYKYQADDYADFRRPAGAGSWEWYDGSAWTSTEGQDVRGKGWTTKAGDLVTLRVPAALLKTDFTAGRDTVRMQVYVAKQTGGDETKTRALDSVPQDATADQIPPPGGGGDRLRNWVVTVPQELQSALTLQEVAFDPEEVMLGEATLLTARPVLEPGITPSPVFQVFADLVELGGDVLTALNDEGREGDAVAGDGLYSRTITVPANRLPADVTALVQAVELTTGERASATAPLSIVGEAQLQPILTVDDAAGDDHGPNQPGKPNLYYTYPTNGVFFPDHEPGEGVFDLLQLQVFDAGEKMLFRVKVGHLTDPSEPGAADWGAPNPGDDTDCAPGQRVDLNLHNIVVLIDSEQGQGSIKLPENRWADVALQDAWEYALIADGWWKGLVQSNGESSSGSWTINKRDADLYFCTNADSSFVDIYADKSLLDIDDDLEASAVVDLVNSWDLIVVMCGHDGDSNDSNWGAVRWVDDGRKEWQFGGGKNGEAGRERDSNIMDLLTHAGTDPNTGKPRAPGRSQEEQLDFTTAEARRRFTDPKILVSVALEAEELRDTAPPQVTFLNGPGRALTPWFVLKDAPVSIIASISDQTGVAEAQVLWRGVGQPRPTEPDPDRTVPLGLLYSDLPNDGVTWIADIRYDEVSDPSVTNVVERTLPDGTTEQVRYIIVSFDAVDVLGNATDPQARQEYVVEIPIAPQEVAMATVEPADVEELSDPAEFSLPEGSRIRLPKSFFEDLLARDPTTVVELRYEAFARDELDFTPHGGKNESVLTANNRFLGTARGFSILARPSEGEATDIDILPEPMTISVHYPRWEGEGVSPETLQLFRWSPVSKRWVLVGGHAEAPGSTVTADVRETGIYGVFTKGGPGDDDILVSGLQLSPNPFSPNGDGLYDFLNITYVLSEPINQANVEIFDMRGERVRTLKYLGTEVTVNRTMGILWDGKDEKGNTVPLGIYIIRVEVQGTIINRWERATAAVAVVR